MENKPKSLFGEVGAGKPAPFFNNNPQAGPKVLLAGAVKRNRIDVSIDDLRQFGTNETVLHEAVQMILTTNQDNLKLETVLKVGAPQQEKHNLIVDELIKISQHIHFKHAKELFAGVIQKLENFGEKGFLGKFFGTVGDDIDLIKKDSFALKTLEPELTRLAQSIKDLEKNTLDLIREIEPYIVTVSFFSDYKKDNFPNDLYVSRLSSLLSTKKTLMENTVQINSLYKFVFHLLDSIQNILLTELPAWFSMIVSNHIDKTKKQQLIKKLKYEI